jgi:tetratricopeptide (TPR) repeat protein
MKPLSAIPAFVFIAGSTAFGQSQILTLPPARGSRMASAQPAGPAAPGPALDPVFKYGYGNKREAAAASLLAGVDAADINRRNERALGLFIMAIERDPAYSRAIYNLGVMSARLSQWDDALKFYAEAKRVDPSPDLVKLIDADSPRVEAIAALEATPDGKARRRYDTLLLELIPKLNDAGFAPTAADKLIKADPSRWEAFAAAGLTQAALGQFPDSGKSFEAAARIAPANRRTQLLTAADLTGREGQYAKLTQDGDAASDKKDYLAAAKLYADAWELSPARMQTGMQAAINFLMADEVNLAVQTLAKLRVSGTPEISDKAGRMLKELAEISPEAKTAAQLDRSGDVAAVVDVAERVRKEVGDLRSPEMMLANAAPAKLVRDDLKFIKVADDQVTNPKELLLQSTETLFSMYQKVVGGGAPGSYSSAAPSDAATSSIEAGPSAGPAPAALPSAAPAPEAAPGLDLPTVRRPNGLAPRPSETAPAMKDKSKAL